MSKVQKPKGITRPAATSGQPSDDSGQVAEEIVAKLGQRPERSAHLKDEIRYVSARFDDELTKLEGAE